MAPPTAASNVRYLRIREMRPSPRGGPDRRRVQASDVLGHDGPPSGGGDDVQGGASSSSSSSSSSSGRPPTDEYPQYQYNEYQYQYQYQSSRTVESSGLSSSAIVLVAETTFVATALCCFLALCARKRRGARARIFVARVREWSFAPGGVGGGGEGGGGGGNARSSSSNVGAVTPPPRASPPATATTIATITTIADDDDAAAVRGGTVSSALRAVGRALFSPLRAIESFVNDVATMDPDGEFLHRVIERIEAERSRIEAEREATRETPKDREARLRVAFERGMAVWELDDGHFLPPEGCHAVGTIREELIEDDNDDDEDNENANRGNQRAVEDDRRRRDSRYGDEEEDANAPLRPRDDREGGGASEGHELVSADVTDNRGGEGEWAGARRRDGDGAVGRDENAADAPRGCYGSDFDGAADDCVGEAGDEENATTVGESTPVADIVPEQEYLYLNTRSNTGGSCDPDSSSARRSTVLKSKSMELKPPTTAAYAAPQDSHKIHNHCAICLCKYERGDFIVTSCNDGCPHAFHQECIVEWLARMQDGTPCPLCRRTFVELDAYNPDDGTAREVPGEAERQRRERRRRSIESGIQRGRVFDMSVINFG